jgi:hypothetical protein
MFLDSNGQVSKDLEREGYIGNVKALKKVYYFSVYEREGQVYITDSSNKIQITEQYNSGTLFKREMKAYSSGQTSIYVYNIIEGFRRNGKARIIDSKGDYRDSDIIMSGVGDDEFREIQISGNNINMQSVNEKIDKIVFSDYQIRGQEINLISSVEEKTLEKTENGYFKRVSVTDKLTDATYELLFKILQVDSVGNPTKIAVYRNGAAVRITDFNYSYE